MTARSGMADLIQELRLMTDAGTADYTAGTVTYWTDDQLQSELDKRRISITMEQLEPYPTLDTNTAYVYNEYRASRGWLESGTAVFNVQQMNGGTAPAYSADYLLGIVTFTADTAGTAYMLTARGYDLNAAASEVWGRKAANAAKYFDFSTDNHRISKSQFMKQCLDMQKFYRDKSETQSYIVTELYRSDVVPAGDVDDDAADRR